MKHVILAVLFFPFFIQADPLQTVVVDVSDSQNNPVPSCLVQIGIAPENPFKGNFSVTDPQGLVEFTQVTAIQALPITLICPNRANVTYFQQTGSRFSLKVDDPLESQITEVSGRFIGWQNVGQKGNVDFALMIPTVDSKNLFNIQWPDLISQRMDSMSVLGQTFKVPSNINLPKQKVKYGLLSATLQKENTAFTIEGSKKQDFMGLAGRFPSSQLIQSYLNGEKDYLKLLNIMDFYSLSVSTKLPTNSSVELPINQFKLKECMNLKSVTLPGLQTIGVSVSENLLGANLQITDLKLLSQTSQKLKCVDNQKLPLVAALATDDKAQATSQVIVRAPASTNLDFRSFMSVPQIKTSNSGKTIEFTRAENSTLKFHAAGYKATLFDLYPSTFLDKAIPQWIIFSPSTMANVEKIDLPELPGIFNNYSVNAVATKHRWEVMWLGIDPDLEVAGTSQNIDFNFFGVATHASKNSIDY